MASRKSPGNGKKASSTSSGGVIQLRAPTMTGGAFRSKRDHKGTLVCQIPIILKHSLRDPF